MRSLVGPVLLLIALSGCTEAPLEAEAAGPDALLVRVFLQDGDAIIRFAAVTGTTVHPFDGHVEIILWPEEQPKWLPQAWSLDVVEDDFTRSILPYAQVEGRIQQAREGDLVLVEAEAVLDDGTVLAGEYRTTF